MIDLTAMSDNYPRVHEHAGQYRTGWGDFKVVPADAIVIERDELPEMYQASHGSHMEASLGTSDPHDFSVVSEANNWTADRHWRQALCDIAVSLYLREHPPVDEREVETLAALWHGLQGTPEYNARRLLATGKIHVDTD